MSRTSTRTTTSTPCPSLGQTAPYDLGADSDIRFWKLLLRQYDYSLFLGVHKRDYLWSGASIVFSPAHGYNRLTLTVTAANGKSFTGHRTIMGYQELRPHSSEFNSMSGDASNGGDGRDRTMDNAALPQTKDR